jgi:hypothetical protein
VAVVCLGCTDPIDMGQRCARCGAPVVDDADTVAVPFGVLQLLVGLAERTIAGCPDADARAEIGRVVYRCADLVTDRPLTLAALASVAAQEWVS